jgi:TetR/AcrR family transcriptional repressor of nem operon
MAASQSLNVDDDRHLYQMIAIIQSMGSSRQDKRESHERIVAIASQRIREAGTEAPGVAEIMGAAGLTHGGFYKHFSSREELVAEALDRAFADGTEGMSAAIDGTADPLAAFVEWYLSEEHRDDRAGGCGVVALGGDVARGEQRLKGAYRLQVESYIARLEELLGGGEDAHRRATVAVSSLVGALTLARAVGDEGLSCEILREVRESVLAARLPD